MTMTVVVANMAATTPRGLDGLSQLEWARRFCRRNVDPTVYPPRRCGWKMHTYASEKEARRDAEVELARLLRRAPEPDEYWPL